MIKYYCRGFSDCNTKSWHGYITKLIYSGNHMEISILLKDIVSFTVCKTSSGFFVYFPKFECGMNLDSPYDINGNIDKISAIFDDNDTVSVVYAIKKVAFLLSGARKRKRDTLQHCDAHPDDELPF